MAKTISYFNRPWFDQPSILLYTMVYLMTRVAALIEIIWYESQVSGGRMENYFFGVCNNTGPRDTFGDWTKFAVQQFSSNFYLLFDFEFKHRDINSDYIEAIVQGFETREVLTQSSNMKNTKAAWKCIKTT